MRSAEFLLCVMLMARTFVTRTAAVDCPSGQFLNTTTQACQPCTVCPTTLTACQLQQDAVCGCPAGQYMVSATELCENCTTCAPGARTTSTSCNGELQCVRLSSYGCLESLEFFNASSGTCVPCKTCTTDQYATAQCAGTKDTDCAWRCPFPDFQFYKLGYCRLNCDKCPGAKCSPTNSDSCLCNPSCYDPTDKYCQHSLCNTAQTPITPGGVVETPASRGQDVLPAWGIGLISLSVVASLILFSTCVLAFCYFSRNIARDAKHSNSTSSESGFLTGEFLSSSAVKGHSETPIPLLSSIDIFQKVDNAQGMLLGANGHIFVSLDSSSSSTKMTNARNGTKTHFKSGTLVTAV